MLRGGANDIGGTLMEETISRMAGSEQGSYKTISDMEAMIAPLGRPLRQRTTLYGSRRCGTPGGVDGQRRGVRVRPRYPYSAAADPQLAHLRCPRLRHGPRGGHRAWMRDLLPRACALNR